ncbi:MAG: hypothetical protein K8R36_17385 [Planctomycetales bacterium]|nr:hypothetical protein [Planctomycetales bacterium]
MHEKPHTTEEKEDFSLMLGGPLYQLFLRTQLVRPPLDLVYRRILAFILVAWLPLAVLTAAAGTLIGGARIPFLLDLNNIRFLISVPLLIVAELISHRRMRSVVREFLSRKLVSLEDQPRFESTVAWIMRLRNSALAEVLLILIVIASYWVWWANGVPSFTTWYSFRTDGVAQLTTAGYWLAFVSLPICRFFLLRWYYRLFIWYLFLWRVSRLPLRLNPLHPDRAWGLAFLEQSITAFSPVLIAQSIFLAAVIGSQILNEGKTLPEFKLEILGFVIGQMLLVLMPLTLFAFQMFEAKMAALQAYGRLASGYVCDFRRKWLESPETSRPDLLGTSDIQSLADLTNSFEVVRSMGMVPFDRNSVIRLAIMIALPMAPLVLTMVPVEELITRLFKMIL